MPESEREKSISAVATKNDLYAGIVTIQALYPRGLPTPSLGDQSPSRAKEPNQPRRSDRNPRTKCGTLQAVTKEVVGIHVLLTRSLFGDGILRNFLLRVSLAKSTSALVRF
jgi:hypothetical protein